MVFWSYYIFLVKSVLHSTQLSFSQSSSAHPTCAPYQAAKLFTNPTACSHHQGDERRRKTQWQRTLHQTVSYILSRQGSHPSLSMVHTVNSKKEKKTAFNHKWPAQAIPFNFVTGLSFTSQSPVLMVLKLALMF